MTAPRRVVGVLAAVVGAAATAWHVPVGATQQDRHDALTAIASWIALDAAPGYETRRHAALEAALPGWKGDRWGNLVLAVGAGRPRRVVACGLDAPAYATTQITDDGYLRLHRIGRGPRHPLWDQLHEAQQVRILTGSGPVPGVVARSNGHFAAQHRDETAVVTADDLWVDVGASSRDEVAGLGIGLLDPVVRHWPAWTGPGGVAGAGAGARAGCAAVVALGESARTGARPPTEAGETIFVLGAQHAFGWVGLSSLLARRDAVDAVVIAGPGETQGIDERRPVGTLGRLGEVLETLDVSDVTWIAPAVRWPGGLAETLGDEAASALLSAVAAAAGIEPVGVAWVPAPVRAAFRDGPLSPDIAEVASMLTDLVELHGTPGHEWAIRRYVLEALPAWARERAEVDSVGNVTVTAGPSGEPTVFMAHMDEVGYEVESVAPDGVVTLARRGGAVSSAWEGQTALLHFDPVEAPSTRTADGTDVSPRWKELSLQAEARSPIRGVFLARQAPERKNPDAMRAWFGLDARELEVAGLGVGSSVTSHKEGLRLGATRFTARALDDRAGTTALLMALRSLDPRRIARPVVFAWSVHEEGGLRGAAAVARRIGATARRVFSIDTFVSSDTPLESPHFALARLGDGPVLRAIENSSISPVAERGAVVAIAQRAGIPLQTGLTQGGTDGTTFTYWGAPNAGLSWPGRYSHSPGEVLDLRDLAHLRDLIAAVATTPEG